MTDKVDLWKQRILERKASGQTIVDWCKEHKITKGSYHYWRRQVMQTQISSFNTAPEAKTDAAPVIFAKINHKQPCPSAVQVTWQDVSIQLTNKQEAHVAAELIAHLRCLC